MSFVKSAFLSFALILALAVPRPSQAAVGLAVNMPALVVSGIVTLSGASVGGLAGAIFEDGDVLRISLLLGFIGIILLDGEQEMAFAPLEAAGAQKLHISALELESYNREIDQVNALASYAAEELAKLHNPTAEDSKMIWQRLQTEVSPETFSTLTKIVTQSKH